MDKSTLTESLHGFSGAFPDFHTVSSSAPPTGNTQIRARQFEGGASLRVKSFTGQLTDVQYNSRICQKHSKEKSILLPEKNYSSLFLAYI